MVKARQKFRPTISVPAKQINSFWLSPYRYVLPLRQAYKSPDKAITINAGMKNSIMSIANQRRRNHGVLS